MLFERELEGLEGFVLVDVNFEGVLGLRADGCQQKESMAIASQAVMLTRAATCALPTPTHHSRGAENDGNIRGMEVRGDGSPFLFLINRALP